MLKKIVLATILSALLIGCASDKEKNPKNLPEAANDNIRLGLTYLGQNNLPAAQEKLSLAVKEAPQQTAALDAMGYYYEKTGQIELAGQYYKKALDLNPKLAAAQNNYGAFLCRQHDFKTAEQYLLTAAHAQNYPGNADAFSNAGLCAMMNNNIPAATHYFNKALALNPKLQTAQLSLAQIGLTQNNTKPAEQYLKDYPDKTPQSLWLQIQLSKVTHNEKLRLSLEKEYADKYPQFANS